MAVATLVYPFVAASGYTLEASTGQELFGCGAVVFGKVFSERFYNSVSESQFMVYAIMGNCLLQRLRHDYASAVVLALFVFRCHVLQQEVAWALYTHARYLWLCGNGSMRLCGCACKCLVERDARPHAR